MSDTLSGGAERAREREMNEIGEVQWQPAIIVRAHQEHITWKLHDDLVRWFGKRALVRPDDMPIDRHWRRFCDGKRTFTIKGCPGIWLCEHEILTD